MIKGKLICKKIRPTGVIYAQIKTKTIVSSPIIPCVQVDFEVGTSILSYIQTSGNFYIGNKVAITLHLQLQDFFKNTLTKNALILILYMIFNILGSWLKCLIVKTYSDQSSISHDSRQVLFII